MLGKWGKLGILGWLIAAIAPAAIVAQEPARLTFSEDVPEIITHTTQCRFDTPVSSAPSPLAPRHPKAPEKNSEIEQAAWWRKTDASRCATGSCEPCSRRPLCGDTCGMRFYHGLVDCLCRPDPCYDPVWRPIDDVGFFTSAVRPVTQVKVRWNYALDMQFLDRAEYVWARADGAGKGPTPPPGQLAVSKARISDVYWSMEAAAMGQFSLLLDVPYRALDPQGLPHEAGFGDLRAGAKTLFFDCELLQVGGQLMAAFPTGRPGKGLGTGHTSLEAALLAGLRIGPDTTLQLQVGEWFSIGGDQDYQGAILITHASLNQVLYRFRPDVALIACAEASTWSFQDGAYTDPVLGAFQNASGTTYASVGPGMRLYFCNQLDLGVAASFGVTSPHLFGQLYAAELRWRF